VTLAGLRQRSRGQSAVEMALTLPVLLLVVLGIVDLGRVSIAANALTHGTREAVRYATVNISVSGSAPNTTLAAIRQQVINEGARAGTTVTNSQISIDYFTVNTTECSTAPATPCAIGTADTGATSYTAASSCPRADCSSPLVGDLVQVKVAVPWSATTSTINRVMPSGFAINATSAGTIE
jgi:Flp pilus assembly protein TadG